MVQTKEGAKKAQATLRAKLGDKYNQHFREIGAMGGRAGHTGGFFANRDLARIAGAKGGRISRRGPAKKEEDETL